MRRTSAIILIAVLAGTTASVVIECRTQRALASGEKELRRQIERVERLRAGQPPAREERLGQPKPDETSAELARLREEAAALRQQLDANRSASSSRAKTFGAGRDFANVSVVTGSDSPEYEQQLYRAAVERATANTGDAKNLSYAIIRYAREHQGMLPSTFEQALPYFRSPDQLPVGGTVKERDPMAGIPSFELVFQGSTDDLKNIPHRAVAAIREREPWVAPSGRLARIYVTLDGRVTVVESDDNFHAWEATHLIPAP